MNILKDADLYKCTLRSIAVFSLFFVMPVDNLNAVLQRSLGFGGSVSQLYKLVVLVLCVLAMNSFRRFAVLIGCVLAAFWSLVHGWISPMAEFAWMVSDFAFMIKWQLVFAIYLFADEFGVEYRRVFEWLFVSAFLLLGMNLLLGFVGIGYSQYGNGEGSMGFFIAGNEVSGMQLVITGVVMALSFRRSHVLYGAVCVFAIIFGALKGTKTGALGVVLLAVVTPIIMSGMLRGRLSLKKFAPFVVFGGSLICCAAFAAVQLVQKMGLIERFLYFYHSRGLLGALFSDRETRLAPFINSYIDHWSVAQKIFGFGVPDASMYGYVEFDFPDALFGVGMLGLCFLVAGWSVFLMLSIKSYAAGSNYAGQLAVLIVMLLLISNMSGHILYSALAMPFMGIAIGMLKSQEDFELSRRAQKYIGALE